MPLKPGDPASTPKGFQYVGLPIVLPQRSTSQADVSYASSAVAHELLHTVNVYHHGEGDREAIVWTRGPGGTVLEGGTTAIRVFREDGTDVTAHVLVDIDKFPDPKKPFTRWLGVHNGQHSGFEDCVMRYDHAEAYQSDADSSVRYTVGEIPGAHLCDTVTGVGINDPGRSPPNGPQSRYGSAIPPRGACKRQILVNDAVPPPTR